MASPEIESHARAMLANRLVAVRRLEEALRSADEAARALRDARARARAEYAAARRAGWSTYELDRLGLSRDRARRAAGPDASADSVPLAAPGGPPADLPSRAAAREVPAVAPDLFRPRSTPSGDGERRTAGPAGGPRDETRGSSRDRDESDTLTVSPTPTPTPTPSPSPSATPSPSPSPSPPRSVPPSPQAPANGRPSPAPGTPTVASADDTSSDPAGDTSPIGGEDPNRRGDWYVDTQAARKPAMSGIPSPGRGDSSPADDQNG